jgi:hypothetical protein
VSEQGDAFDHGTLSGYVYRKCRCDECRTNWAEYNADRRIAALRAGFAGAEHARRSTYLLGCRCQPCRQAEADYKRARKAAREEATK